uniref:DDE Tnp4 domain-containing protein n=1 Tax=Aegilops tauschii subsp. strangulata TaxID=200361 RepID=A0A452YL60_AEGTS
MGYYLVDGIYLEWATFVKNIPLGQSEKNILYSKKQEGARKDVERAFGILQARFAILRYAANYWHHSTLANIMYACIILYNMIVEDERGNYSGAHDYNYDYERHPVASVHHENGPIDGFANLLERNNSFRDRATHRRLKRDLIQHIWDKSQQDRHNN